MGAVLKWFISKDAAGQLANDWQEQAGPPITPGVKTQILTQFRPINQDEYNEDRLKASKWGAGEPTTEYFYDVLNLCRRLIPHMAEANKLRCLWRGLKPTVIEKLWSLKPTTCDGFLEEVKRLQELTSRSKELALGVLGKPTLPAKEDRIDRLEHMMEELLGSMATRTTGNPPQQGWRTNNTNEIVDDNP